MDDILKAQADRIENLLSDYRKSQEDFMDNIDKHVAEGIKVLEIHFEGKLEKIDLLIDKKIKENNLLLPCKVHEKRLDLVEADVAEIKKQLPKFYEVYVFFKKYAFVIISCILTGIVIYFSIKYL